MKTVTREIIADLLKQKLGFSSLICEEITSAIFSEILTLSINDEKLLLTNFGKFQIHSKGKRPGINLKTKESVEITPRKVFRFHASRSLKKMLNTYES